MCSGVLNDSICTLAKPALLNMASTCAGSENAKGPGACGLGGVAAGGMKGCTALPAKDIHGFSLGGCQQTKTIRPLGLSALRKFLKAASGSAKNITPKRENTKLYWSLNSAMAASACSKLTLGIASALTCACANMGSEISTPVTEPLLWLAPRAILVSPQPQPTSSADSLAANFAAASPASESGASRWSKCACWATHMAPALAFQYLICSALSLLSSTLVIARS